MTVVRPHLPRSHPDRFSECQRAIEDYVFELLGDAIEAGWSKDEILAAIIEVADNTTLAIHQNVLLSVETELKKLKKKADDPAPHPRRHWNRCCYNALDFLQIGREKWVEMNRRWRSFE